MTAVVASLAAAAAAQYDTKQALAAADVMESARAFDAARRQLTSVLSELTGEAADGVHLRICALWARESDVAAARRCYDEAALTSDEARGRARYHAAVLAAESGDPSAPGALATLIDELPGTLGARRALLFLRCLASRERGAAGEADFLLGVASRLRAPVAAGREDARDLYAESLVEAGRIRLRERQDAEGAARLLAQARDAAAGTRWADDALYGHAEALRALGEHARALALYESLIDARVASWFVGSYDSVFYDDALLARGETLEALGRRRDAEQAYAALADKTPASRLQDDAAFRRARLRRAMGEREALAKFITAFPESPLVREARRLMEAP